VVFEFGNGIFAQAAKHGVLGAEKIPDFATEYLAEPIQQDYGLVQWVALSGEPADIARADRLAVELFPEDAALVTWLGLAKRQVRFQGLPARAAWMTRAAQAKFGAALNKLVRGGEITAPMVLTRERTEKRMPAPSEPEEMPDPGAPEAGRVEASWILSRGGRAAAWAIVADGSQAMGERLGRPVLRA
jgi:urocanate hydratase